MNTTQTPIESQEEVRQEEASLIHPSLDLKIEDNILLKLIERRVKDDDAFYDKMKLEARRKKNEEYYLGKQVEVGNLDENWQIPYIDNIIWQDLEVRCALASTRIPDILVIPPADDPFHRDRARKLEQGLDVRLNNEEIRRLIKDGIRNNQMNFIGVAKVRWDDSIGKDGDYIYELVNPKKIGFDHKATIPHDGYTADNMEIIYEWIEESVSKVMAKFPDKKEELKKELEIVLGTTLQLASKMRYLEIWFTWYDRDGERQEGVCWKYKNILLGKSKNPYYDWEGVDEASDKLDENGQPTTERVMKNFFDQPRKPYIFFSYQNLGNTALDDTSAVEQTIPLQRSVNKRGRQITEISDNAVPKKVFNGNFITKEEARRVSNDPGEHVWLDGGGGNLTDVRQAFGTVVSQPPSPILFDDQQANRGQIDSKFSTHSITRGEMTSSESGISRQITKSGDTVIMDDLVNTMVVRVVKELAGWSIQMMKNMYDKDHFVRSLGKDGEMISLTLTQDKIDDGVALQVKASSTSKEQRRVEAIDMAKTKNIDPLSLFEDLDVPNPRERAERLVAFLIGEQDAFQTYRQAIGIGPAGEMATGDAALGAQEANKDLEQLLAGQLIEPKGIPTEQYVQVFLDFVNSGKLEQVSPQAQQVIQQFVQKLKEMIDAHAAQSVPPAQAPGTPPTGLPAAPPAAPMAPPAAPAALPPTSTALPPTTLPAM
jgi:hypothetical protein